MLINSYKHSLLSLPQTLKQGLVFFFDLLICALSVWCAFGLRLDQWGYFQSGEWLVFIAAFCFSFPLYFNFGLYKAIFRYAGAVVFLTIVRIFIIYTVIFFFIFTLIGVNNIPRSIGVIQPILLFIGVGASRYFVRSWLGSLNNVQRNFHRTQSALIIYGAGSVGRQLASSLVGNKEMLVKGFVDDDFRLQGRTIDGISVYRSKDLQNLIRQLKITDVVLAIPSDAQKRRCEVISSLNGLGVRVRATPGLIDLVSGRVRVDDSHDLDMNDLLGRDRVPPKAELLEKNILNQVVLVTGAGGSIGSELCRQIIKSFPKKLILIDSSEYSLYKIYEELKRIHIELENKCFVQVGVDQMLSPAPSLQIELIPYLASVRDRELLLRIFRTHQPTTVYHTAAYKHVPLIEKNPAEGIRNNVFGTLTCVQVSLECGVSNFILVSTDKAVRPTNVMGASKRISELILQAMAEIVANDDYATNFSMVRFGNVLGSSGSVVPLFSAQIRAGGPITLTHAEVTRYFMTIPEAAQLVIQAGAMAVGGDVFVLDMGKPVRIYDLAVKMVYLNGLLVKDDDHPHGDIEIRVTGLRPGEKLFEELLIGENPHPTYHPKIMKAHEDFLSWDILEKELKALNLALDVYDDNLTEAALKKLVPSYQRSGNASVTF